MDKKELWKFVLFSISQFVIFLFSFKICNFLHLLKIFLSLSHLQIMPSRFMEAKFFSTRRFNWNLKSIDSTINCIIYIGLYITFVDIRIVITFSICDSERLAGGVITWVRYTCQVFRFLGYSVNRFWNFLWWRMFRTVFCLIHHHYDFICLNIGFSLISALFVCSIL